MPKKRGGRNVSGRENSICTVGEREALFCIKNWGKENSTLLEDDSIRGPQHTNTGDLKCHYAPLVRMKGQVVTEMLAQSLTMGPTDLQTYLAWNYFLTSCVTGKPSHWLSDMAEHEIFVRTAEYEPLKLIPSQDSKPKSRLHVLRRSAEISTTTKDLKMSSGLLSDPFYT